MHSHTEPNQYFVTFASKSMAHSGSRPLKQDHQNQLNRLNGDLQSKQLLSPSTSGFSAFRQM